MNTNVSRSIIQLNEKERKELTTEIKEVIAKNLNSQKVKTKFTAAQLWSIQRKRKTYALSCIEIF